MLIPQYPRGKEPQCKGAGRGEKEIRAAPGRANRVRALPTKPQVQGKRGMRKRKISRRDIYARDAEDIGRKKRVPPGGELSLARWAGKEPERRRGLAASGGHEGERGCIAPSSA